MGWLKKTLYTTAEQDSCESIWDDFSAYCARLGIEWGIMYPQNL